ncbi:hypothetical protein PMAYCL1PPCAC_27643 [Pristionchus mayeri]|uniref:Uncharacterized protein n=1 Tax=Pristionchus mayeri TaxID=1317129 RepID=A0AAN5I9A6_9BILA|nr:hypothetical protein PMAYCL1PPCAC_27643 [Pristionchus mayeri]
MRFIITLTLLAAGANAQMERQCLCSEVQTCKNSAMNAVQPCVDRCQGHAIAMGASIPAVRQCIMSHEGQIRAGAACLEAAFGNSCAARPGLTVPKRFPESFQIAAMREITAMIKRSGLTTEAIPFIAAGRKMAECAGTCARQHSCSRLGCGLSLPSDNIIVATAKRCAIQAGLSTPVARQFCHCVANAGVRTLVPICDRIVIS